MIGLVERKTIRGKKMASSHKRDLPDSLLVNKQSPRRGQFFSTKDNYSPHISNLLKLAELGISLSNKAIAKDGIAQKVRQSPPISSLTDLQADVDLHSSSTSNGITQKVRRQSPRKGQAFRDIHDNSSPLWKSHRRGQLFKK